MPRFNRLLKYPETSYRIKQLRGINEEKARKVQVRRESKQHKAVDYDCIAS